MKLHSVLIAAFVGFSHAAPGPRMATKTVVNRSKLTKPLAVRGGAGPLDPLLVAKGATAFGLASHSLHWLVPEKALEVYGVRNPTPPHVFLAQRECAIYLAAVLTGYLRLFPETDINKAVGYGSLPLIIDVTRSILNDDEKRIGLPNVAQAIALLVPLLVTSYVCLNNMEISNTLIKVSGIYHMVRGSWYVIGTQAAGKAWGFKDTESEETADLAGWVGTALITFGLNMFFQAQGVDIVKVAGYCWIPTILRVFSSLFITKKIEKLGLNKSPYVIWLLLGFVVIGTLAI